MRAMEYLEALHRYQQAMWLADSMMLATAPRCARFVNIPSGTMVPTCRLPSLCDGTVQKALSERIPPS
ncbi:hypothetical protein HPB50_001380 [Hyalomma asiaticum]|uniref:Uncharacterized protein n=1 Tax=Hyalomma asiaticum TaxID=266040 RepID=A0ACB7T5C2_HYAAI|nr:hypothetical protein HPB50_001380 [Hyalomma asiaticum]